MPNSNRNGRGLLPDFIAVNRGKKVLEMIENATTLRQGSIGSLFDTRRSINDECGYPETGKIDAKMYRDMWEREPIADRVVSVMPDYVWQQSPEVIEVEESDTVTEFEEAWDALPKQIMEDSLYEGDESNPIIEYLHRLDLLAGVGAYGVMLLGLDDGKELSEPAEGIGADGKMQGVKGGGDRKLLYLQCFDQYLAQIAAYETDRKNPRYGKPVSYNLTLSDPSLMTGDVGLGKNLTQVQVHWSRVIHYAKNRTSSDVWGRSEMLPVWNPLMDIQKVRGGDAEGYWRACYPGLSIESHPQLGGDVEWDLDDIRDDLEQFTNTMQRWLAISGASIKQLAPQIADPSAHLDALIGHICIKKGIPRRVFEGSERGELASSQDALDWMRKVRKVATRETTPCILVPFVSRLIAVGVLPTPKQWTAKWPEPQGLSKLEKAQVATARMDVMSKYLQGGVESLMVPHDLLTRELDYTDEEATAILDVAADLKEERDDEQAAQAEEQAKLQADAMKQAGVDPQQQQVPPNQGPPQGPPKPEQPSQKPNPFPPKPKKPVPPQFAKNSFCPTGEGGGIDPSCGRGEGSQAEADASVRRESKKVDAVKAKLKHLQEVVAGHKAKVASLQKSLEEAQARKSKLLEEQAAGDKRMAELKAQLKAIKDRKGRKRS